MKFYVFIMMVITTALCGMEDFNKHYVVELTPTIFKMLDEGATAQEISDYLKTKHFGPLKRWVIMKKLKKWQKEADAQDTRKSRSEPDPHELIRMLAEKNGKFYTKITD